jgi:DNA-binding MarR family transcriptional regulator
MELRDLLISKVRVKLLEVFLVDPEEMYHVRELVRRTGEEINAVRRELAHMEKCGMVKKEPRGNRLYYWFRKDYLFYNELLILIAKSTGLGSEILKNRAKIGRLSFVVFSQKFVQRIPRGDDPVDVLIVGEVILPEMAALIKAEEGKREQEIFYTVFNDSEFTLRKQKRDPFIVGIMGSPKVLIIGNELDLVS